MSVGAKAYFLLHGTDAARGNSHGESAGDEALDVGELGSADQWQLGL